MPCRIGVILALGYISTSTAVAQVRLSERGTVSQTVDGTTISVDYARPQTRGRDSVFGSIVHWGEVWTPGANWATTVTVSKDVKINGQALPKGSYSMWIVPAQSEDWTVLFHPRTRLFHTQRPSQDSASLRLRVRPESGAPAEILTFAFTTVARDRTTLEFRWHKSVIPFTIEVPSSRPVLAVEKMSAYTGAWIAHSIGEAGKVDTLEMTITVRDGKLMVRWVKWAWELELLPTRTPHVFLAGFLEKGELVDTEAEYPVVFTMAGDRAVSFVSRSDNGDEWMRGIRAK